MTQADLPQRIAIVSCPLCRSRHVVRVNAARVRVECGAAAEVATDEGGVRARVLPNGREAGARLAAVIAVRSV